MSARELRVSIWLTNPDGAFKGGEAFYTVGQGADMTEYGWMLAQENVPVSLQELTQTQIANRMVKTLQAQRDKILGEAQAQATRIDAKINEFLALEMKP